MRGKRYQALIVAILLLTALPYSPFLSRASSIEKDTLAVIDSDGDGLRDDVQRWLAVNYGTKFSLEEYRIAKTYAILFQRALLYSDDKDKALNLVAEKHILWDALNYLRVKKKLRDHTAGHAIA